MKQFRKWFMVLFVFTMVVGTCTSIKANASDIDSTIYVTDDANMLSKEEELQLEKILASLEQQTSIEYAVVTTNSLEGKSIEEVANQTFRKMGLGKKDKDNGLLLFISKGDRKFRLEVGYGLEGVIPDTVASHIIGTMTPFFKESKYADGITNALSGTFDALQKSGEYKGLDINNQYNLKYQDDSIVFDKESITIFFLVFLGIIFLGMIFSSIFGGFGSYSSRSSGGGFYDSDSSYSSDSGGGDFGGGDSGGGGASGDW